MQDSNNSFPTKILYGVIITPRLDRELKMSVVKFSSGIPDDTGLETEFENKCYVKSLLRELEGKMWVRMCG